MAAELVTIEASDLFSLGGSFIAQTAARSIDKNHAKMKKANGDYEKFSATFNTITNLTVTYKYNAESGLGGSLPNVGSVANAYVITQLEVNSTFDDYPTITLTGHQHDQNPHTANNEYAPFTDYLSGAVGAYDLAGLSGGDVCAQSSTYTLALNHIDAECDDGGHFVGNGIEGMHSINVSYIGSIASTDTIANWTITNLTIDDSNDGFDTSSISAERVATRS